MFGGSDTLSLGRYIGGDTIQEIFYCDHATLPLQGSVKSFHNRLLFGSKQSYPVTGGSIWSYGSKATIPPKLHNIGSNPEQISAISVDENGIIMTSSDGLYTKASNGFDSIWRSRVFNFATPFTITSITIPFSNDYTDTEVTINLNYDNGRVIDTHTVDLEADSRSFTINPTHQGTVNFYIEIKVVGNDFVSVNLPIRIEYELHE